MRDFADRSMQLALREGEPTLFLGDWKLDRQRLPMLIRSDDKLLLPRFLSLLESSDGRNLLSFAKQFGALDLCEPHSRPFGHYRRHPESGQPGPRCLRPASTHPLSVYQEYAASLRAIQHLMAALREWSGRGNWLAHASKVGVQWDREQLQRFLWRHTGEQIELSADEIVNELSADCEGRPFSYERVLAHMPFLPDYGLIERAVNWWLQTGGVRLVMDWPWHLGGGPSFQLAGNGLWGALARGLAGALLAGDGWAFCQRCSRPFQAQGERGRPRRYCDVCSQANARQRGANQRYRNKRHLIAARTSE